MGHTNLNKWSTKKHKWWCAFTQGNFMVLQPNMVGEAGQSPMGWPLVKAFSKKYFCELMVKVWNRSFLGKGWGSAFIHYHIYCFQQLQEVVWFHFTAWRNWGSEKFDQLFHISQLGWGLRSALVVMRTGWCMELFNFMHLVTLLERSQLSKWEKELNALAQIVQ